MQMSGLRLASTPSLGEPETAMIRFCLATLAAGLVGIAAPAIADPISLADDPQGTLAADVTATGSVNSSLTRWRELGGFWPLNELAFLGADEGGEDLMLERLLGDNSDPVRTVAWIRAIDQGPVTNTRIAASATSGATPGAFESGSRQADGSAENIPEPTSLLLLGVGLAFIGRRLRRRDYTD